MADEETNGRLLEDIASDLLLDPGFRNEVIRSASLSARHRRKRMRIQRVTTALALVVLGGLSLGRFLARPQQTATASVSSSEDKHESVKSYALCPTRHDGVTIVETRRNSTKVVRTQSPPLGVPKLSDDALLDLFAEYSPCLIERSDGTWELILTL